MNFLRVLLGLTRGRGKQLLPNTTVCCTKEKACLPVESEQLQDQFVSKLLFPQSIHHWWQRENLHNFPLNNAGCLSRERQTCLKIMIQSFHTGGSRLWPHRTEVPLTLESEDVTKLSQQVLKSAGQTDVMVRSLPVQQVEQLVLGLYQCGWKAEHIRTLLSSQPFLLHHRRSVLPSVHLLLTLGFDLHQVRTVLQQIPTIVETPALQVNQVMDTLRDLGFEGQNMTKIVADNPSVLLTTKALLYQRVTALRQLFKSADIITLVMRCPCLLTEDWEEQQAKFDYVFHEMNITQKQMVYASLFNHSLSHIRKRHTFLVRTGLFNMSKRREGEKSPNATLDQIIDSSDKAFCKMVGDLGVDEYRAFGQLFNKEQASQQDADSDHKN